MRKLMLLVALLGACKDPTTVTNPQLILTIENWRGQDTISAPVLITVRLTDSLGVPSATQLVRFIPSIGIITEATTGVDGRAVTTWPLPATLGRYSMVVGTEFASSVSDTITVTPGRPVTVVLDTSAVRVVRTAHYPLSQRVLSVKDRLGNVVTNPTFTVTAPGWSSAADTVWSDNRLHTSMQLSINGGSSIAGSAPALTVLENIQSAATYDRLSNGALDTFSYACLDMTGTDSAGAPVKVHVYSYGTVDSVFHKGDVGFGESYGGFTHIYVTRRDSIFDRLGDPAVEPWRVIVNPGIIVLFDQRADSAFVSSDGFSWKVNDGFAVRTDTGYVGGRNCRDDAQDYVPMFLRFSSE